MALHDDEAALSALSINQEQLLHELESKYLSLKSELSLSETERQTVATDKKRALEELECVSKVAAERNEELCQMKQQLLKLTMENDALGFKLQTATSLAERRLSELEELKTIAKEHHCSLVNAQRQEMQALERAAKQEALVAPLEHALARAKKETEVAQQHSQWVETQLSEKTKTVQELRLDLAKRTHDLEEFKIRSTEELTSTKRQLESARLANRKIENALIKSKESLKELQASKMHDEELLQAELSAQRRIATLYEESAADASARVAELQKLCDSLRKSLTDSEQALARETEQTNDKVEHLFREQAETSESRIQALQDDLQNAEQKIQELEKKNIFSLQTASTVAELSSAAGEAHLAAHGLTSKQMYDHIVDLEQTLQAERTEKEKLQLYMDRIVKEVQEKAPILMGLRLDHERTVASHTQLSERLEQCVHELAKRKHSEQQAWKEKIKYEEKCKSLAQSVDDLSRQVQHLLFRTQEQHQQLNNSKLGEVESENLLIFKDVKELQVRNQQLLIVIREMTEMNKLRASEKLCKSGSDVESTESSAHLIVTGDSDDEYDQSNQISASCTIKKRLSMARKEIQELRMEREQEREMITAIVKQRDMYRVLLAQSDNKFLEGGATSSGAESQQRTALVTSEKHHASFDVSESRKLRELQKEFEDYKKEKRTNMRMLQEAMDQERSKSSELRLAQMQAQVEATCSKERYEASEERFVNAENELVRLRSKSDHFSSLIVQHQQLVANAEAKLETANSQLQSLMVERDSAVRNVNFISKNEENMMLEMTTLRLDNTNLLKLMESMRRMEAGREERNRCEVETLVKKVSTLEIKLQNAFEKFDSKEAISGAQVLAAAREKQAVLAELTKLKEAQSQLKEQYARAEEQKIAYESKSALLEKETTHLREQLRKGASTAASDSVAALEVQLRDTQLEVQALLISRKTLAEYVTKYKALAEASDKSLAELSMASEKWKQSETEKMRALETSRELLSEELEKVRAELLKHDTENIRLREELDQTKQTHKRSIGEAIEKQKVLQLQANGAVQQMEGVREEMKKMKHELEMAQENYERELQLHAAEVAKSSSSRRELENYRKTLCEREADTENLRIKIQSIEKDANVKLEALQKLFDDAVDAKNTIIEQNKLLHSQLERAAIQVRRTHEADMFKVVGIQQEAGEEASAFNAHDKEIDDLRSLVAFLRRESEIAESKLELSQQEVQRGRAKIFSLETTIERLRVEMKALLDAANADGKQTYSSAAEEKRIAQLEQLSLLRESNATLRDESQKYLAKFKEAEAKVRNLEAKILPLQNAETLLKTQVASLKQEVETLNDANKCWKQRLDQVVEKYHQIDPTEHDKVVAEKEALTKELAELEIEQRALKVELDLLRSSGGKELAEEQKKVENWSKQYERIKGFAKNWKNKAESLTKQLAEKNEEVGNCSSAITILESKLASVQAQISTVISEKVALEMKLAACEAARQDIATNANGVSATWEKERQTLKAQLELETKKCTQLKDFNARLMSGLKSLKKENNELKDHAASALKPAASLGKVPLPSPPLSPQQHPAPTFAAPPTKSAAALTSLSSSPQLEVRSGPAAVQSSIVESKAKPVVPSVGVEATSAASAPPAPPNITSPSKDLTTVSTQADKTTAEVVSTAESSSTPPPNVPAQATTFTSVAPPLPVLSAPAPPLPVLATLALPVVASRSPAPVAEPALSIPALLKPAPTVPTLPKATPTVPAPLIPAPIVLPGAGETGEAGTNIALPAPPAVAPQKAASKSSSDESAAMTAEEQLRQFALRSIKKQVGDATRFTLTNAPASIAEAKLATATATENKSVLETKEQLTLDIDSSIGAFGSGGPSGLVFGKPGVSLPIPSPASPAVSQSPHEPLSGENVPPESLRRSQRLARFGSDATNSAAASSIIGGGSTTKRPLGGAVEGTLSVQKVAKTSEYQTTKTTTAITTITNPSLPDSESKQEEDTSPGKLKTTELHSTPPST